MVGVVSSGSRAICILWELHSRRGAVLVCEMRSGDKDPEIRLIHDGEVLECVAATSPGEVEESRTGLRQMLVDKGWTEAKVSEPSA